ncbi:MAG: hypothetical protein MZW92_51355 [Comamonadaceae bacterium]|nr:hypothetical protein [Comamonadaceae bacterium]
MTDERHLRHQRHRARDRLAAAPLARACSSITTTARPTPPASCCSRARVIPYRGSWLDFEFDAKDYPVRAHRPPPQAAGRPSCCARSA